MPRNNQFSGFFCSELIKNCPEKKSAQPTKWSHFWFCLNSKTQNVLSFISFFSELQMMQSCSSITGSGGISRRKSYVVPADPPGLICNTESGWYSHYPRNPGRFKRQTESLNTRCGTLSVMTRIMWFGFRMTRMWPEWCQGSARWTSIIITSFYFCFNTIFYFLSRTGNAGEWLKWECVKDFIRKHNYNSKAGLVILTGFW